MGWVLGQRVGGRFDDIEERIGKLEGRFADVEARIGMREGRFAFVEARTFIINP